MIASVRQLLRSINVETLGWWKKFTQVGQQWACRKPKKVSSRGEPEKYWVDEMFTPNHKIIPYKFIHYCKCKLQL